MAPKAKAGDKGKSKDASADKGGGKQKGAQSINVRHVGAFVNGVSGI